MIIHNITHQFHAAAKRIVPGTLVKDDHFSLFEAVGALEVGDAKMDSGCLEPGESLEDDFDVETDLLPEELIWLMDELLNREVAWLMGYPLSQTLFTSVHIDRLLWPDPKNLRESTFIRGQAVESLPLTHMLFRAYCLLLIKAGDLVLSMITAQHYYEEEDFTTQLFNRELLHRFPGEQILELAHQAVESLEESDIPEQQLEALHVRLGFRVDVLEMLLQHANNRTPSSSLFTFIHDYLDRQQKTHDLGKAVPEAFSTKLQRRLASTVPPRPMVTVSMDQVWSFWHQMSTDCQNVFAIHQAGHSQDLFTAYQIFAFDSPQPSTYPRALLQSFLRSGGFVAGRTDNVHFTEEDLQTLTMPGSQLLTITDGQYGRLHGDNQKVSDCMQGFLANFERTFVNLYQALCLNSCRIRRTFCHALDEWDRYQSEVEEMDSIIQAAMHEKPILGPLGELDTFSFSLSSWVYHHKLSVQRLIIQMGFDQMIYAPHELAGMHWYLATTCDTHLSHLERISHFVTARDTDTKQSKMPSTAKQNAIEEYKLALRRLYRQYAWVKATQALASTLHAVYVVLQRWGIFAPFGPVYSSDSLRYEIRMKPFLQLSIPEAPSPEEFATATYLRDLSNEALLDQATKMGAAAKRGWEEVSKSKWNVFPMISEQGTGSTVIDEKWSADVKDCLKAAIAANICVLTLKKAVGNEEWMMKARKEAKLPGPGERGRWHRWWIVPTLPSM